MKHQSKFPFFVLPLLLCAAVSGCTSTSLLRTDPQTAEDILEASGQHPACVTLANGIGGYCYSVAVRKDSTRWRLSELGPEVAVPTDSVISISISSPQAGAGILGGVLLGGLVGGVVGDVTYTAPPTNTIEGQVDVIVTDGPGLSILGGVVVGMLIGGIVGGVIGANTQTNYTVGQTSANRLASEPQGQRTWVVRHGAWMYMSSDSLKTPDTTQTKFSH